jgi:hypothetical protein
LTQGAFSGLASLPEVADAPVPHLNSPGVGVNPIVSAGTATGGDVIRHHHSIADEATSAGLLGAATVAAWFLLLDFIAGRPLHTASVLGQVLLLGDRTPDLGSVHWGAVELYGFFHFLSFLAVGWLAVRLLHMAIRQPAWLVGLLILFVTIETAVFGVSFAVFQGTRAEYLRVPVLIGNLLAVLVMGTYLWRTHRLVVRYVARVPLGDTGDEPEVKSPEAWHAMARWRTRWKLSRSTSRTS